MREINQNGTRQKPYVLTDPRNGRTAVLLAVSSGEDVCFVTMDYADYYGTEDTDIIGECVKRGWLAGGDGGSVEEVSRRAANKVPAGYQYNAIGGGDE